MKPKLRIETKGKQEDEEDEPVSPTGQYLNSKALSVCILGIIEIEAPIDDSFVIPQLRNVFLPINPKFSSIMVSDKNGVSRWKRVEVNLQDHVNIPSFPEGSTTESYDDYFDEYLTQLSVEALPQDRPLWEIHICKYPTSKAAGHCIFKLHHALGDGYSIMGALLSCVQRADNPSLPVTFPSTRTSSQVERKSTRGDVVTWLPRALSSICRGVCDFGLSFMKITCIADDMSPIRSGNEGKSLQPMKISTIDLSLDQIKLIKAKLGTTVNDVVAGMIFLGIRLYMQEIDTKSCTSQSTALVLFNTRNIKGYKSVEEMNEAHTKLWGNRFTSLHVAIPKLIDHKCSSPVDFIYKAKKKIMRLRKSPAIFLTAEYLEIIRKCRGPEAVAKLIYNRMKNSSLVVTNMIGPIEQVAMANHPVKGMYFMVCGTPKSVVITILSYMQTIRIGVGVGKDFIDSQKLTSCIEKAFHSTLDAATESK